MKLGESFPIQITILSLMVVHAISLLISSNIATPHKIFLGVVMSLFATICLRLIFKD